MAEIPRGLSFNETEDGYALHRRNDDDSIVTIPISKAELATLQETISSWKDRESSPPPLGSKSIQEIAVFPVAAVGLAHEILMERLLLTLALPSGGRRTYALGPHQVAALIANMPDYLAEMTAAKPQPQ